MQWLKKMSLILILEVAPNLILIKNHAHGTDWHMTLWASSGSSFLISRTFAQVAVIQILAVGDTLMCPGALSLLPSVWLHYWAWEPILHAWEGVQLQPLGAH